MSNIRYCPVCFNWHQEIIIKKDILKQIKNKTEIVYYNVYYCNQKEKEYIKDSIELQTIDNKNII